MNKTEMLQFPWLGRNCNIFHFITTRKGGVSRESFASFNLGEFTDDNPSDWQTNRDILCGSLGITKKQLFVPLQTHEDHILDMDAEFLVLPEKEQKEKLKGVDALLTAVPDVCIAVTTADCVPILVYSPEKNIIASIHAGWRGTVLNIAGKTIGYMKEHYSCDPAQLLIGIGPCISSPAFEVGQEVVSAFSSIIRRFPETSYINPVSGKTHLDLSLINKSLLLESGIKEENIELSGLCTYEQKELFFSARRQGIRSGRMLTGIMITK